METRKVKIILESWRKYLNEADTDGDGSLDPGELRKMAADLERAGAPEEEQDHQHLLSDPDVGGRRGLKLLIQLKKLTPGEVDSPDKLDDFLSVARRGRYGQELEDLLYDIYSSTHLSIEDIVDYWSSI